MSNPSDFDKRRYATLVTAHSRVEAALALLDCDMVETALAPSSGPKFADDEEQLFTDAARAVKSLRHALARRL